MTTGGADVAGALIDEAITRWPPLSALRDGLTEAVADVVDGAEEPSKLRADIVLARALADAEPAALAIFERELVPPLAGALERAQIPPHLVDDALSVVRFRLLVSTDTSPAKIATYRGRSSLSRWLYVVAIREARALAGKARAVRTTDLDVAEGAVARTGDLESEYLAREHREAFSDALAVAFAALSSRERLLLRLDVLEGLSDGAIAKIFSVHRTTALRWVEKARAHLISATKDELARTLSVRESELDSLLRGLASHLDLSLGRLLAESQRASA